MKIYYDQIKEDGLDIETGFSFKEENDNYDIKSFVGHIEKAGDAFMLIGSMVLDFSAPCDRCLEPVFTEIRHEVALSISPLGYYPEASCTEEDGLTDEEAGMYVTPKDNIDLHEFLREEAILLTPLKRLCREDCKGICDGCGALLNKEDCRCTNNGGFHWSALERLKKNN